MIKEKRILSYFICWLLIGLFLCFIGITKTYAANYYLNYEYYQKYYDNYGSSVTAVSTTWNDSLQSYVSSNIGTTANSYGAGISISSPLPIIANHTYTLSFFFEDRNNIALSSKNHIAISTSLAGAATNYANGNYYVDMRQSNVNNNTVLQFVFTAKGHGNFIFIPWTTTTNLTQNYVLTQLSMEDLGSEGVSQQDINNSLNNQTNELNQSIQNSTDTITGEINDMESAIIDSNKETQEVIKDQFNDCRDSTNLFNANLIPNSSGIIVSDKGKTITMPLNTTNNGYTPTGKTLRELAPDLKVGDVIYLYFDLSYNSSNTYIYLNIGDMLWNRNYSKTITEDMLNSIVVLYANKFTAGETEQLIISNFRMVKNSSDKWEPYGEEICQNKIDETNDKLNNINGSLNNSNSSGATNDASNFFSNFTTDTFGLTSIITAPLSLINTLTSSSCATLSLPLPYLDNKYLELPCMNTIYSRYFGSFFDIYQTITFGIVAYWVIVRVFNQVKDFKNPDHDEIEVLDL